MARFPTMSNVGNWMVKHPGFGYANSAAGWGAVGALAYGHHRTSTGRNGLSPRSKAAAWGTLGASTGLGLATMRSMGLFGR